MYKIRLMSLLLATAALPGAAFAADLAPTPTEPVPPVVAPLSWAGFYAGVNAGYAFAGDDRVGVHVDGTYLGDLGTRHQSGFLAGAQVGYNYQIDNFVLGLETDFQGAAIKDSVTGTVAGVAGRGNAKTNWYGTLRPRLGYAFDSTLVYATGGLAYGQVDYKMTYDGVSVHDSATRVGWVVGAGIEQALTDHLSAKIEYQYVNLGSYRINNADGSLGTKPTNDFHSVRVGLNYKF